MTFDLWEYVLNPVFLLTTGVVLAGFVPMLYSIWRTWEAAGDESHGSKDGQA